MRRYSCKPVQRVVRGLVVAILGQSAQRVIRGLDVALLEHRGRSRCWQLGRVEPGELATKTESCLSTADQVNGRGNRSYGLPGLSTYEVERANR